MATSPLERTKSFLRAQGYRQVHKVEHWNPHVPRPDGGKGVRVDLAGVGDVLAWGENPAYRGKGVLMIQTTAGSGILARLKKIKGDPVLTQAVIDWLLEPGRFEIHGWRKLRNRWKVRRIVASMRPNLNGLPDEIHWEEVAT